MGVDDPIQASILGRANRDPFDISQTRAEELAGQGGAGVRGRRKGSGAESRLLADTDG